MTDNEIYKFLQRLRYKPDAKIDFYVNGYLYRSLTPSQKAKVSKFGISRQLKFSMPIVKDSKTRRGTKPKPLFYDTDCWDTHKWTEDDLLDFVKARWTDLELHERDEWLQLDGKLLSNPHDILEA